MASLEKGRKLLEQKGPASVHFSCLMVAGTVMLTLLSTSITAKLTPELPVAREEFEKRG
jgi:hypothetical protein